MARSPHLQVAGSMGHQQNVRINRGWISGLMGKPGRNAAPDMGWQAARIAYGQTI